MGSVTADDVAAARPAVETIARRTPVLSSRTISERAGGVVALKAENLQRTGSFKIRGVAAKLAALGDGCTAGVVGASAGNHGQALAAAARTGARDVSSPLNARSSSRSTCASILSASVSPAVFARWVLRGGNSLGPSSTDTW